MSKYIKIQCSKKMKDIICMSIKKFAYLAYPKANCSECNLVASDALLNAAAHFEKHFLETGEGILNRRLRMIVKTAVETHYRIISELENRKTTNQCEVMLRVCKGEAVENSELIKAEKRDSKS